MFKSIGVVENIPVISREESGKLPLSEENNSGNRVPSIDNILERVLLDKQYGELAGDYEKIQKRVEPLESYKENIETSLSRIDEIDHSTLILSSDVLFDFDSSELSEDADAELESAIKELGNVEGGVLEIIGHTDDENTAQYNQELSEKRAESVRNQLEELTNLSDYDEVRTAGRSFNEPIADNKSEEGRAQNRRVAIQFTPLKEEIVVESMEVALPEPEGGVAEFPGTVETKFGNVEIESLKQVNGMIIGKLKVFKTEETGLKYNALTHTAGIGARGWSVDESIGYNQFSAYAPTLITESQRYYPLDYYLTPLSGSFIEDKLEDKESDDVKFIIPLAERSMPQTTSINGAYFYATVAWPAVAAEKVTIELADTGIYDTPAEQTAPWRITNVPISKK